MSTLQGAGSSVQANDGTIMRSVQYLNPYSGMPINIWVNHKYEIDIPGRQQRFLTRTGVPVPMSDLRAIDLHALRGSGSGTGGLHIIDGDAEGLRPLDKVDQRALEIHYNAVSRLLQRHFQVSAQPTCVDIRIRASQPELSEECLWEIFRAPGSGMVPCFMFHDERPLAYPECDPLPTDALKMVTDSHSATEMQARTADRRGMKWLLVEVCHPIWAVITKYPFIVSDPRVPTLSWDIDGTTGAVFQADSGERLMRRRYLHYDDRHRWCYLNNQRRTELLVRSLVSSKELERRPGGKTMRPLASVNINNDRNAIAEDVIKMRFVIWG